MSEWAVSSVSEVGCRTLVELGYMPKKQLIGWRPTFGEAVPKPRTGETVVFADFFERGFSVPTHPFFRRLLRHYGVQLHHLNPNGIIHISIFITLCEAYLGIEPHFGLWKWLYWVKLVGKRDPNDACAGAIGGASIQLRPKAQYISIPLRIYNKGWQSRWFYCRNEKPLLPDFVAGHGPVKRASWTNPPTADEVAEVDKIIPHLNGLFQDGLDGALLIATFLSRRIQPIKKRCHPMSEFTGYSDPTRESLKKLTLDEILSRVDQLVSIDTDICADGKPLPCHHKRPPKNDLSKYLSATLEEDEEGVDMPQATDAVTIASYPPLKKPRTLGAGSYVEVVQQKAKEVVARSCSELAQQRESVNSVPIAQPLPDDEDTETMSHSKKRKSHEALACCTPDPGLQDLSSPGRMAIYKRKILSKDVMLPCLLPHSSASPFKEVSGSACREASDMTVPHREEMPDDDCVLLSPPQAASPSPTPQLEHREEMPDDDCVLLSPPQASSPSPTPQLEPRPLQLLPAHQYPPTTTLPTLIVPESIEMTRVPWRPLPCDNLRSSQQSMPDNECVPLSPPQSASPSPTPQLEPHPLQLLPAHQYTPTTTLPTLTSVPESIEMMRVPCRPLPCDNLRSSQQSVGFATYSVEVEGEVLGKKAEEEQGIISVQMEDMESNLLCESDDEMECVEVDWEKVKEAATFFETRLAKITLKFKRASELIVKLKQENKELKQENKELEVKLKQENKDLEVKLKQEKKDLEVKLKQENKELEVKLKRENKVLEYKLKQEKKGLEVKLKRKNEVTRAFEKKARDLSKELDIVRADCDSLRQRFQDAKKRAADLHYAFNAPYGKFSADNPTLDGVEVPSDCATSRLS